MRKFKLRKQYPGSGAVGTIIELTDRMNPAYFTDNPDYYQEVTEKDYEIIVSRIVPQEILSVRRLSDGEVFTVGDSVKVCEYSYIKDITEIIISSNPLVKEGIWLRYDSGSSHLSHATKAKLPIFITHDGKDIFAGDKVWYVSKDSLYCDCVTALTRTCLNYNTHAYFLTKEEAENYIKKNKVLFTTEDDIDIKHGDTYYYIDTDFSIDSSKANFQAVGMSTKNKYFSTRAAAENYLVQKSYSLSIEDFWEFDSWGGSNIAKSKRLKRLVKERLNLQ